MKLRINPFNRGNPMTLKDAAVVGALSALTVTILTNLANATVGQIRADPWSFLFDVAKTFLVTWAGNFGTLAGLEKLIEHAKEPPE